MGRIIFAVFLICTLFGLSRAESQKETHGDGYSWFRKGYAAAEAGNYDLAIEFYTRAIEGGDLALTRRATQPG